MSSVVAAIKLPRGMGGGRRGGGRGGGGKEDVGGGGQRERGRESQGAWRARRRQGGVAC